MALFKSKAILLQVGVIMEDIFEIIIRTIAKLFRVFGGIFHIFIEILGDLISHLTEKYYKKYPKTTILVCLLLISMVVYVVVMLLTG
ncbi:MAG: hypothetical protein Q3971_09145 [Moraxella sp.]|nr:hypothetical protein [Moraxella sp.]